MAWESLCKNGSLEETAEAILDSFMEAEIKLYGEPVSFSMEDEIYAKFKERQSYPKNVIKFDGNNPLQDPDSIV
jgi:hypothetical protein